jgi:hypothetical protein
MRSVSRGLPMVVFLGAALAAVLATQPWNSEEAAGGTVQYRVCDTVIEGPLPKGPPSQGSIRIVQLITPDGPPSLEVHVMGERDTLVTIDPTTAKVESAGVPDARLQPVLDTLRLEPLDPSMAPWPYTDATQKPPVHATSARFDYRSPDPGSGLVISMMLAQATELPVVQILYVANCRSLMEIKAEFWEAGKEPVVTVSKNVHPDDEAAFQRFYDEVSVGALPY